MKISQRALVGAIIATVGALGTARAASALPSADEVLQAVGLSAGDRQKVLSGQYVTADLPAVSDRDLSIAIAFVVKVPPAELAKEIVAGKLIKADTQVQAYGELTGNSTAADLAGVKMDDDTAEAFAAASTGESLNLAAEEIAAFNALKGAGTQVVQQQLKKMLLARSKAYQASGLSGIAEYARDGGTSDPAADLRKATDAAGGIQKYVPTFHKVLDGYPQASMPGMNHRLRWVTYDMDGKPTYVLAHILEAADGDGFVVAQRQFYVSTGYNAEQAIAAFWPVAEGTLVVYTNHTFTDQVEGFGGSVKRKIGRGMMEKQLEKMFSRGKSMVQ